MANPGGLAGRFLRRSQSAVASPKRLMAEDRVAGVILLVAGRGNDDDLEVSPTFPRGWGQAGGLVPLI